MFGMRFWGLSVLYAVGAALLIGVPTVLIPNSLFLRMTPTSLQDYAIWGSTAVLVGPVMALATLYPVGAPTSIRTGGVRAFIGTLLSYFSVGCPICNKVVVFLLGVSGTMTFFNPLRPLLGATSLVLLAVTLWLRIRVLRHGCPVRVVDAPSKQER